MYGELILKAKDASKNSYSPYSRFKVGAAVLDCDLNIYTGTNIENASFGLTVCAERVSVFKMVCDGKRKAKALALYCDTNKFDFAFPCGACRQVMAEFFDENADIVISISTGEYKIYKLKDLLPNAFKIGK